MKTLPEALRHTLLWIAAAAAFLLPAVVNGQPFLFPDSVGYFRSGDATLEVLPPLAKRPSTPGARRPPKIDTQGDGVSTQRSPFYGLPVAIAEWLGSQWLIALAQTALALVAIALAARRLGVRRPTERAGLAAILGLVTGVGVFASTVMPDILAALMILGMAIVLASRSIKPRERLFWIAMILISCLAHKGHVLIALVTLPLSIAVLSLLRRVEWRPVIAVAAAVVLGGLGHIAVDRTVERVTGSPPVGTPFLLARMIGDGTVPRYLDAHCAEERFRLCAYRDRMPMTENEFLWSADPKAGLIKTLSVEERAAISAESWRIVAGAIASYPLDQAIATLGNVGRQLLLVGVTEFGVTSGLEPRRAPEMARTLQSYRATATYNRNMPLDQLSTLCVIAYLGAAAALLVLGAWRPGTLFDRSDPATIRLVVILGVVVNGVVCGAISGVFDRYQGRVAWLLPFIVLAWLLARRPKAQLTTTAAAAE